MRNEGTRTVTSSMLFRVREGRSTFFLINWLSRKMVGVEAIAKGMKMNDCKNLTLEMPSVWSLSERTRKEKVQVAQIMDAVEIFLQAVSRE